MTANYISAPVSALGKFSPSRLEESRQGTSTMHPRFRRGQGFCECCQKTKPAPSKRLKGWKCDDCESSGR